MNGLNAHPLIKLIRARLSSHEVSERDHYRLAAPGFDSISLYLLPASPVLSVISNVLWKISNAQMRPL